MDSSSNAEALTLWYQQPAKEWMTEALPIGNGHLGAMLFGGVQQERIQFNEESLWTGDENDTGAYQAFGDIFVDFPHTESNNYRRELDISRAVHTVTYECEGVKYRREAFASAPAGVIVMRFLNPLHPRADGEAMAAGSRKENPFSCFFLSLSILS
ncbi:MAG: glycoside hydrolase family 95 protein [Roseimicrobium sp.]